MRTCSKCNAQMILTTNGCFCVHCDRVIRRKKVEPPKRELSEEDKRFLKKIGLKWD